MFVGSCTVVVGRIHGIADNALGDDREMNLVSVAQFAQVRGRQGLAPVRPRMMPIA
jgi:hypothetical protein